MTHKRIVSLAEVRTGARQIANTIISGTRRTARPIYLYGVPRGGIAVAYAVAAEINRLGDVEALVVDNPDSADVILDDIYDSGKTADRYQERYPEKDFTVLFDKRRPEWKDNWLVMPWEVTDTGSDNSADDIVTRLLEYIGDDPAREGLTETPKRVLNAWKEWATGYKQEPGAILKTFKDGASGVSELVIVHDIPVISKCEHHLADIIGIAHVGYIPSGRIVGLSKLARLVDVFARRLQVQERMTNQIADSLMEHLTPVGVGVIIRATHACMSTRGVKIHGSTTTTSAMRGALMEKPEARKEFIDLCNMAERNRS